MKKSFYLFCICYLFSFSAMAQWSIGARFGGTTGLSLKNYPASNSLSVEIMSAFNFDDQIEGFTLSIMLEKMGYLSNDRNLAAFAGVGETMIFGDEFYLGASGILGFDWRPGRIGLQLDWMPTWIFINASHFSSVNAAFTIRWMFKGRFRN